MTDAAATTTPSPADLMRWAHTATNRVARRYGPPQDEAQALSDAAYGVAQALRSYDPDRGLALKTHCITRAIWAVLEGRRRHGIIPRAVYARARAQLTHEQVAAGAVIHELLPAHSRAPVPLHAVVEELSEGGHHVDVADPAAIAQLQAVEARVTLRELLRAVPARHRRLLRLYYVEGLTLAQIGRVLGVTESRACQIHRDALHRMRRHAAELGDDRRTA